MGLLVFHSFSFLKFLFMSKKSLVSAFALLVLLTSTFASVFVLQTQNTPASQDSEEDNSSQNLEKNETSDNEKKSGEEATKKAEIADMIRVDAPLIGQRVGSPLVVKGEAKGFWFFEAAFPVKLLSADGKILAQGAAQAQGDWMTEKFVPFSVTLNFSAGSAKMPFGTLVLQKDNPSGDAKNAQQLSIPVIF